MHAYTKNSLFLLLIFILSSQCFAAFSENELIDQLRSDYRVLQQARGDLERSGRSNKSSSSEVTDLENWIRQLSDQLAEDCRQLSILSAAAMPADLPCDQLLSSNPAPAKIDLSAESTQRQKTKQLEDQLNGSLGDFDERLLREQDRIKARAPRTESTAAAGSGASGGESAGASGSAADESGTGSKASQKDKRDREAEDENDRTASNEKSTPGQPSSKPKSSAPADIPDGSDDDVIARQIREAAEKETDPELKKKLWDEYRRYRDAIK